MAASAWPTCCEKWVTTTVLGALPPRAPRKATMPSDSCLAFLSCSRQALDCA